jgi:N-acetylglucosamine kinase-like BadF-type ATPase
MNVFLGIDGGGTQTRAIAVDGGGKVLGTGESGPSNYHNIGIDKAVSNISAAASVALGGARATHTFVGCAGIKSAADIALLKSALEIAGLAPAGGVMVSNDLHNALAGGLKGRAGIALIAGTGTNCLGRGDDGATFMCGGWGWLLDDRGGGFGLAIEAFKAAARAADGRGNETRLLAAVLAFLNLSEPDDLLRRLYVEPWSPDELAAFAPAVVHLAESGDGVALEILKNGADCLAELVARTAMKLRFAGGPEVVILGGCARSGPPYQPMIEQAICQRVPEAIIREPEFSPHHGAAINVLRFAGLSPLPELQLK